MSSASLLLPLKWVIQRECYIPLHFALPSCYLMFCEDTISVNAAYFYEICYRAKYQDVVLSNVKIYLISEVYTTDMCAVFT
jgi:hypothetical protein